MNKMLLYILIILFFSEIYNSELIEFKKLDEVKFNDSKIIYKNNIRFGNIKFLNNDNKIMFCNFPRQNGSIEATFAYVNLSNTTNNIYYPWPNKDMNKIIENDYCTNLKSVVAFEIDNEDNIYILDNGKIDSQDCNPKLLIYNYKTQKLITNHTFINSDTISYDNLIFDDILIDSKHKYIYILYHENNNEKTPGIFLLYNNENKKIKKLLYNNIRLKPDNSYSLLINDNILSEDDKKKISFGLSCDGETFFFSPLSSKMIYSISTSDIYKRFINEDEKNIEINSNDLTINEAYKNDATSSIILSNMGNLYFIGLEKNLVYISDLVDDKLYGFNYKGLRNISFNKSLIKEKILPIKITINNGYLYVLSNGYSSNENKILQFKNNYTIYYAPINKDKPYIFSCAGLKYQWQPQSYIIWGIFLIIVIFVLVFVVIGNKQDKDINIKNN